MSAPSAAMLTLSTLNLSVDGARAAPDLGKANMPVTEAAALSALRAFARLSAMELVDVEAKIYLAGPRGKVAVQNSGGKLFAALVPESVTAAVARTPEEIIAIVTSVDSAAASTATETDDAIAIAATAGSESGLRRWWRRLNSGWTVGVLAVAAAILAYATFAPETPEGTEIIRDPARISRLHADFNGRYGAPGTTLLVLDHGRLTGRDPASTGATEAPLFEKSYTFGLREKRVVLVVDNGALLEPQPDGSLKFLDSTYPKQAR